MLSFLVLVDLNASAFAEERWALQLSGGMGGHRSSEGKSDELFRDARHLC